VLLYFVSLLILHLLVYNQQEIGEKNLRCVKHLDYRLNTREIRRKVESSKGTRLPYRLEKFDEKFNPIIIAMVITYEPKKSPQKKRVMLPPKRCLIQKNITSKFSKMMARVAFDVGRTLARNEENGAQTRQPNGSMRT